MTNFRENSKIFFKIEILDLLQNQKERKSQQTSIDRGITGAESLPSDQEQNNLSSTVNNAGLQSGPKVENKYP